MKRHYYFLLSFVFIVLNFLFLECNEASILATARQYMDPQWIPTDWWLSTGIEYGNLFNFFAGLIYKYSSYTTTFIVGRIILYTLWAYVFSMILVEFKITPLLIPVFFYVIQKNPTIGFGEWMIPGFETKAFAYVSFFAAIIFLSKGRKQLASFLMGVSFSFHLLVGLYLTIALFAVVLIDRNLYRRLSLQKKDIMKGFAVYLIGATFGIIAIIKWKLAGQNVDPSVVDLGGLIYVTKRVLGHVMFRFKFKTVYFISVFLIVLFIFYKRRFNESILARILVGTTFVSLAYVVIGILVTKFGEPQYLKFYFFRTVDVLIPITTILLIFSLVDLGISKIKNITLKRLVIMLLLVAGVSRGFYKCHKNYRRYQLVSNDQQNEAYQWIKNNTKKEDTFLISPSNQYFYINAERPAFVAFKHSPQKEKHIVEWFRRMTIINGGKEPESHGWWLLHLVTKKFEHLKTFYLKKILQENDLQYVFVKRDVIFGLEAVFKNDKYVIYKSP